MRSIARTTPGGAVGSRELHCYSVEKVVLRVSTLEVARRLSVDYDLSCVGQVCRYV